MAPTSNGQPLFMLPLLCRRTTPGAARQSIQDEAAQAGTVRVHVGGLFGQYLTAYVCPSCVGEHHQISSLLPCKCALSNIQPSARPLQKPLTAVLPFKVRLLPVGPASLARELLHDVSGVVWRFLWLFGGQEYSLSSTRVDHVPFHFIKRSTLRLNVLHLPSESFGVVRLQRGRWKCTRWLISQTGYPLIPTHRQHNMLDGSQRVLFRLVVTFPACPLAKEDTLCQQQGPNNCTAPPFPSFASTCYKIATRIHGAVLP